MIGVLVEPWESSPPYCTRYVFPYWQFTFSGASLLPFRYTYRREFEIPWIIDGNDSRTMICQIFGCVLTQLQSLTVRTSNATEAKPSQFHIMTHCVYCCADTGLHASVDNRTVYCRLQYWLIDSDSFIHSWMHTSDVRVTVAAGHWSRCSLLLFPISVSDSHC
jgi:hypothetical protein